MNVKKSPSEDERIAKATWALLRKCGSFTEEHIGKHGEYFWAPCKDPDDIRPEHNDFKLGLLKIFDKAEKLELVFLSAYLYEQLLICRRLGETTRIAARNHEVGGYEKGCKAAAERHRRTNEAKEQLKRIWAEGNYTSRDICAEQECGALGLSFSTARKALRKTPDPNPWPAKKQAKSTKKAKNA
jgi:hypothetical protein